MGGFFFGKIRPSQRKTDMSTAELFRDLVNNGLYHRSEFMCIALRDAHRAGVITDLDYRLAKKEIANFLRELSHKPDGVRSVSLVGALYEGLNLSFGVDRMGIFQACNDLCVTIYQDWENRSKIVEEFKKQYGV